jgi:hypothetical protein
LVYPNPSKGIFNVVNGNNSSNVHVFVSDTRGNIILEKKISEQSFLLDLNDFMPGIYYLKAIAENSTCNLKLIIQ